MATSLTSTIAASFKWNFSNTVSLVGTTSNSTSFAYSDVLSNGTAADNADLLYIAAPTISASGTLNLDLAASLTDIFGNSITFARVKGIFIKFDSTTAATTSTVTIGNHASAAAPMFFGAAAHTATIHATGVFMTCRSDATGWPITATTADILKIVNNDSSNAVILNIAIWGASA